MSSSSSGTPTASADDTATTTTTPAASSSPASAAPSTTPESSPEPSAGQSSTSADLTGTVFGGAAQSGTNSLPSPTATAVISDSQDILCPNQNETLFQDPSTGKQYLLLCGRDYSSLDNAGAIDINSTVEATMNLCIENCATTAGCMAVGWGNFYGQNTCWLKSHIGEPNWSPEWYFAIETGQVDNGAGLSGGAIAGIAVGAVLGVIGLGGIAFVLWWLRRRRTRQGALAMRERELLGLAAGKPPVKGHYEVEGDKPPLPGQHLHNPNHPYGSRPNLPSSRTGSGAALPHYPGSTDALYRTPPGVIAPGSSGGLSGSNTLTPVTPRGEKGATEWEWQPKTADAELPTRDMYRYGPEYEIMTHDPSTLQRRHRPPWAPGGAGGGPGSEAAEQKFLLQDMVSAKQQQKRNTEAAESSRVAGAAGEREDATVSPQGTGTAAQEDSADQQKKRQSERFELP